MESPSRTGVPLRLFTILEIFRGDFYLLSMQITMSTFEFHESSRCVRRIIWCVENIFNETGSMLDYNQQQKKKQKSINKSERIKVKDTHTHYKWQKKSSTKMREEPKISVVVVVEFAAEFCIKL